MIEFVVTWADDLQGTPMGQALERSGLPHRVQARRIDMSYRSRMQLLTQRLPALLAFSLRAAWRSLVSAKSQPGVVVVGSDLEALAYALVRLFIRAPTRIVLLGFILTARRGTLLSLVRQAYFRVVMSQIDGLICYSRLECARYERLYPSLQGKVHFVPFGLHFWQHETERAFVAPGSGPVFSAGRSGRDYPTLVEAVRGLPVDLRIACDLDAPLRECADLPNVTVLRKCFGGAYVRELEQASIVVVPLAVDDISAGQMVMLQAMAYRKPVIVTRIETILDYVDESCGITFVPARDPVALRRAIQMLLDDPEQARALGTRAYATYLARLSMDAYITNILEVVGDVGAGRPRATAT